MQALGCGFLLYLANLIRSFLDVFNQDKIFAINRQFPSSTNPPFPEARLRANPFCDDKFHLHGSKKNVRFSLQSFRFETDGVTERWPINIIH